MSSSGIKSLVLASGSPRRLALLSQLAIPLVVDPADVKEERLPGEEPGEYVARIACKKAKTVAARHAGAVVLGADTAVVLGERLFGKPRGEEDALRMLGLLSGQRHEVLTGICAIGPKGARQATVSTSVRFKSIADAEACWYVSTGEPMDKAGAYAIQGRGGMFVASIEGSYSNVVGLPLVEALELLASAGLEMPWEAQ
jgi:septum formation protein